MVRKTSGVSYPTAVSSEWAGPRLGTPPFMLGGVEGEGGEPGALGPLMAAYRRPEKSDG